MYGRDGNVCGGGQTPFTKVVAVRALDDYRLWLRFAAGEEKIFDFRPELKYPAFRPLEDKAVFNGVYLNMGTVMWNDGEIDVSPDYLLQRGSAAPESSLTPAEAAKTVVDRERGYGDYHKEGEFMDSMTEEEFETFLESLSGRTAAGRRIAFLTA